MLVFNMLMIVVSYLMTGIKRLCFGLPKQMPGNKSLDSYFKAFASAIKVHDSFTKPNAS